MQFVILINIHCRWVVLFGPPTFTCHWQNRFSFVSYHALISLSRVLQSGSLRWSSNYILYTYFEEHPHNHEYFSRWEGKTFTNAGYAWQHCAYHFDYISCAEKLSAIVFPKIMFPLSLVIIIENKHTCQRNTVETDKQETKIIISSLW